MDLVARLTLRDQFSAPMRQARREMRNAQREADRLSRIMDDNSRIFGRFGRHTGNVTNGVRALSSGFGSLVGRLNPVALGFGAITTAAVGAYGAVKVFNATVGEAMKMQQSQVVIGAMFDDEALSKQYMKMMDEIAIKSPILDSQQMYGNSKSFITASKDLGELEKMWSLAERLSASDPAQGLEGAVYALRELFSGDSKSIVERFELPRSVMKDIKNLPLDQQLTKLDEYFNKIGLTTKLIDEMGGTALGMWAQVKERFQLVMRDMGEPSLKAVSTFLGGLIDRLEGEDMQKFADWGGRVINNMVTGLSNSAIKLYDWFATLANDPEFQSKSTLTGKINFIVDDIASKLQAWYDGGGKDKIVQFGSDVAQVLIAAMDATDEVFALGAKMGSSIWTGVIDGVKKSAAESPIGKVVNWSYSYTPQEIIKTGVKNAKKSFWYPKEDKKKSKNSHSGGLDRVPYSGYQATLHKDEKVLTAQQAREHRDGNGGSGGVNINIQNMSVRNDSDIKSIALELARYIEVEGGQMTT
ncbi:hypothetical protein MKY29_11955 [Psychrobacillus sp. FSL K6-2365]|uniref:hypothetical protein n=1 Tax=Psychrobacillus sp. FSL K6-2365 TaxID=2921546 RepID=UPI0030F758D2